MRIESVVYRRTKDSNVERGLLVNEGLGPLLDVDGKPVEEVWDYNRDQRFVVELDMGERK